MKERIKERIKQKTDLMRLQNVTGEVNNQIYYKTEEIEINDFQFLEDFGFSLGSDCLKRIKNGF